MIEANEIQQETFSTLKSGVDAVIQSPNGSGKSTTIVLNVIQRLEKPVGESTRALVIVENKAVINYNPIFETQTLTYLRLMDLRLGLVINFGEKFVKRGVHRVVNNL